MHHTDTAITNTINPLLLEDTESHPTLTTTGLPVADFSSSANTQYNNQWGFTYDSSNFYPVPTNATPKTIKTTSAPATGSTTALHFGARVSTTLPAGSYSDTITLSATANFASGNTTDKTIYDISTMQEMTSDICNATTTPLNTATTPTRSYSTNTSLIPETILRDTRDNKRYTIRKLADGRCWMVDDLRLAGGTTITNQDSDITAASYTLPVSETSNDGGATLVNSSAFSDDDVAYVYDNPNNENGYASSYYSFQAATAGTGSSVTTNRQNAPASVCPKGWKLPTGFLGDDHTYEQDSDFLNLMTTYGYERDSWYWNMTETGRQAFESAFAPLYAGYYRTGSIDDGGVNANYWASTVDGADNAYYAYFDTDGNANSANDNDRDFGFQVRCLASS